MFPLEVNFFKGGHEYEKKDAQYKSGLHPKDLINESIVRKLNNKYELMGYYPTSKNHVFLFPSKEKVDIFVRDQQELAKKFSIAIKGTPNVPIFIEEKHTFLLECVFCIESVGNFKKDCKWMKKG